MSSTIVSPEVEVAVECGGSSDMIAVGGGV